MGYCEPMKVVVPLLALWVDSYVPLFMIERSTNANAVHYDARVTGGSLHPQQPVVVYWVMRAREGQREDLNPIEKSRVYGFTIQKVAQGDVWRMFLAAQKGREIRVALVGGVPRAQTRISGQDAYLQKIYISTGRLNIMHVNYIDLFGADVATGESRWERIVR